MSHTYDVRIYRDGKWWLVEVPELDGLTQARHLREAEEMARDYIALTLDIAPDSFAVSAHIDVPADAQTHLEAAARLRAESARANSAAAEEARAAARSLVATGMPLRDAAVILGVSHQRVGQLVG